MAAMPPPPAPSDVIDSIRPSQTNPSHLVSAATAHPTVFSAIAELIDNAADTDCMASDLSIDFAEVKSTQCLSFLDNGTGMTGDGLFRMLSLGFSDKAEVDGVKPIGRYGSGFKTGSMGLGTDAIVLTKQAQTMSVGLLSQTYLKKIEARTIYIPMATWDTSTGSLISQGYGKSPDAADDNVQTILSNCPLFESEDQLKDTLKSLPCWTPDKSLAEENPAASSGGAGRVIKARGARASRRARGDSSSGTLILIWNLKRDTSGCYELDFDTDRSDIINRRSLEDEPDSCRSLRTYCSILYLKPRMHITLRGKQVKLISLIPELKKKKGIADLYRPRDGGEAVGITLGDGDYLGRRLGMSTENYGICFYHRNRLIKSFYKANILTPNHVKQDFVQNDTWRKLITSVVTKVNEYWDEVLNSEEKEQQRNNVEQMPMEQRNSWVMCDECHKWRMLTSERPFTAEQLAAFENMPWFCEMNPDPNHNDCNIRQQYEAEVLQSDAAVPFPKPYKKKRKRERNNVDPAKLIQNKRARQEFEKVRMQAVETTKKLDALEKAHSSDSAGIQQLQSVMENYLASELNGNVDVNLPSTSTQATNTSTPRGLRQPLSARNSVDSSTHRTGSPRGSVGNSRSAEIHSTSAGPAAAEPIVAPSLETRKTRDRNRSSSSGDPGKTTSTGEPSGMSTSRTLLTESERMRQCAVCRTWKTLPMGIKVEDGEAFECKDIRGGRCDVYGEQPSTSRDEAPASPFMSDDDIVWRHSPMPKRPRVDTENGSDDSCSEAPMSPASSAADVVELEVVGEEPSPLNNLRKLIDMLMEQNKQLRQVKLEPPDSSPQQQEPAQCERCSEFEDLKDAVSEFFQCAFRTPIAITDRTHMADVVRRAAAQARSANEQNQSDTCGTSVIKGDAVSTESGQNNLKPEPLSRPGSSAAKVALGTPPISSPKKEPQSPAANVPTDKLHLTTGASGVAETKTTPNRSPETKTSPSRVAETKMSPNFSAPPCVRRRISVDGEPGSARAVKQSDSQTPEVPVMSTQSAGAPADIPSTSFAENSRGTDTLFPELDEPGSPRSDRSPSPTPTEPFDLESDDDDVLIVAELNASFFGDIHRCTSGGGEGGVCTPSPPP